jgi:hypothetical protein
MITLDDKLKHLADHGWLLWHAGGLPGASINTAGEWRVRVFNRIAHAAVAGKAGVNIPSWLDNSAVWHMEMGASFHAALDKVIAAVAPTEADLETLLGITENNSPDVLDLDAMLG